MAMGGSPQLYGKAPQPYPTPLPYHRPKGPPGPDGSTAELIPLAGFSFEQLWHFLQIEYPEARDALPEDRNWQTIGQFYSYIRCLLSTKFLTDKDFRQGRGRPGDPALQLLAEQHRHGLSEKGISIPGTAPPVPTPDWAKPDRHPSGAEAAFTDAEDSHVGPVASSIGRQVPAGRREARSTRSATKAKAIR